MERPIGRAVPVRLSITASDAESCTPGIGLSASPLNKLKTAALPAMPSVSTPITTRENPGFLKSMRTPKRTSCITSISIATAPPRHTWRASSWACSTLPNSLLAASRADSGSSPPAIRSAMAIWKCCRISASRSRSMARRRKIQVSRFISTPAAFRVEDGADRRDELRPAIAFGGELLLAGRGDAVELDALLRLAQRPLALHPALFFKAMERGVERSGFDLQRFGGLRGDGLPDGVAMLRSPLQRLEDEHVQRALQQLQTRAVAFLFHQMGVGSLHPWV